MAFVMSDRSWAEDLMNPAVAGGMPPPHRMGEAVAKMPKLKPTVVSDTRDIGSMDSTVAPVTIDNKPSAKGKQINIKKRLK